MKNIGYVFLFLICAVHVQAQATRFAFSPCDQKNAYYNKVLCEILRSYQRKNIPELPQSESQQADASNNLNMRQDSGQHALPGLLNLFKQEPQAGNQKQQIEQTASLTNAPSIINNSPAAMNITDEKIPDNSCVAFGDSLSWGMTMNGCSLPCLQTRKDGSYGNGFLPSNSGNSFSTYSAKINSVLNSRAKFIDWELGTNFIGGAKGNACPTCGPEYLGRVYEQIASAAKKKGKILFLPVYNNKYSSVANGSDQTARKLAKDFPDTVKLIDYTQSRNCKRPDGGDNVHYNGNCYKEICKMRKEIIEKTMGQTLKSQNQAS